MASLKDIQKESAALRTQKDAAASEGRTAALRAERLKPRIEALGRTGAGRDGRAHEAEALEREAAALEELSKCSGTQFDPAVITAVEQMCGRGWRGADDWRSTQQHPGVVALVRGERWGWLSGFGVAVNAGVLIWVGLLVTGGWK